MGIVVPQYAAETADGSGDAVFIFPAPPQGETWCGTTNILKAPSTAMGVVAAGGVELGETVGNGSYGPWACNYSQTLTISVTGLTPDTQYQAVWHADTTSPDTYPAPITQVISNTLTVPEPLEVDGTVTVNGEVVAVPDLAPTLKSGQIVVTTTTAALPAYGAVQGVIVKSNASNTGTIEIGPAGVVAGDGFILDPGEATPILPVTNSGDIYAVSGSDQGLSFLVL